MAFLAFIGLGGRAGAEEPPGIQDALSARDFESPVGNRDDKTRSSCELRPADEDADTVEDEFDPDDSSAVLVADRSLTGSAAPETAGWPEPPAEATRRHIGASRARAPPLPR